MMMMMTMIITVPLPDAPLGVQVEAGPQRGTLLVTWTPVPDKKPVDADAAELIRTITGYTVYVDGTLVKQLDSPTGQCSDCTLNTSYRTSQSCDCGNGSAVQHERARPLPRARSTDPVVRSFSRK